MDVRPRDSGVKSSLHRRLTWLSKRRTSTIRTDRLKGFFILKFFERLHLRVRQRRGK